jgi:dTDP-4-amino-4,6-dideoxygalactose transaminase
LKCESPREAKILKVPLVDLAIQHRELEKELVKVFRAALRSGIFVDGAEVAAFEEEFAEFCGAKYSVGVSSGTDALRFALLASGIGPGDEVITVPFTFIATAEAISQVGARPVFVDVEEKSRTMDPQKLEEYLSKRKRDKRGGTVPKAIVPVHLYGHPADMDSIMDIAQRHGLLVIEDACQAHGALYLSRKVSPGWKRGEQREGGSRTEPSQEKEGSADGMWLPCGSMGLAAAFSFYPSKNLGACGEAGAVVTQDQDIADKVRMLRDHGQTRKYRHEMEGYNGRLDAIQAGILRVKLKRLPHWNAKRRERAKRYNELLSGLEPLILPNEAPYALSVYHLYVIRTEQRDKMAEHLSRQKIGFGIHYPLPLHLQRAYRHLGYGKGDFPVSEKLASQVISLPLYPEMTDSDQEQVVEAVKEFLKLAGEA